MFTIFCLLCLCGNREYPDSFQNKSVSSSFKWVPNYILFLVKLKGEGRPFWSGQAQIYPQNYLLHVGGNVNYYKSVHHPILTLPVEIGNTLAIFKQIDKLYFQLCDHAFHESSAWYCFTKFLNQFFRNSHHLLEIYILNIEENHLFSQVSLDLKNNDSVEHV